MWKPRIEFWQAAMRTPLLTTAASRSATAESFFSIAMPGP